MRTLKIDAKGIQDFREAEELARQASGDFERNLSLMAWYDRNRNMEGPREACAQEGWKCSRVYADNHGARVGVIVNDGEYEFYFARVPSEFEELDREEALAVHGWAQTNEFDDVQGG
ncbi:MAG: hypothetical protein Kow0099_13340 [Candidatus Abyssubacteria bacterium]